MRVLILGAGAVGLAIAARLSEVCTVTAVTRDETARAINHSGLRLSGAWGEGTYRFHCATASRPGETFDFVLVTSKSQSTRELCEQNVNAISATEVASLQNGVGNEETLAEFGGKVIGGVVMTGFIRKGREAVHVIASAGPMKIGRFPSGVDEGVSQLAGLMNRAGIRTVTVPRIRDDIWAKNLINATVSSLCTVVGVQCGGLDKVHSLAVMRGIAAETFAVTREIGVILPWSDETAFCEYIRDEILRLMADHPVSMLQDIQAGKMTEIDHINGPIIELGRKYAVPTPYNTCITSLVHCIEWSGRE